MASFEYHIIVYARSRTVNVFRYYNEPITEKDGTRCRFWAYTDSIQSAIAQYRDAPLIIIVKN